MRTSKQRLRSVSTNLVLRSTASGLAIIATVSKEGRATSSGRSMKCLARATPLASLPCAPPTTATRCTGSAESVRRESR